MMDDENLRKVEGWSPGACSSCWRETEDLTRVRSIHHGDPDYVSDDEGHRNWFNWYCRLCANSYAYNAHKYGYERQPVYACMAQIGWAILDELREEV